MNDYVLMDYNTGKPIRVATKKEYEKSVAAQEEDGGGGVISVDNVSCYVIDRCFIHDYALEKDCNVSSYQR
jgi:hypothetical protein